MGLNVTEKLLKAHIEGDDVVLKPGEEIGIRIDQTLTQDATGTLVYLQLDAMGLDRIRNELAVSYVDHNTIQVGPENADDHVFLRSAAARFGAVFSKAGNGICHQVHLERFGVPGRSLLGSDSHTCTCGGLGMLAIGAGGVDVAAAMAGRPFFIRVPKVVKIEVKGSLPAWVSAKDLALKVLEIFSTRGNVDCVFEYAGAGLKSLDVPSRATVANMGAECGVTTSVFPSDAVTRDFLEAEQRAEGWSEIVADHGADYSRVEMINLSQLEPMAAAPHSPGNVVPVLSLVGTKVDQVLIGSCTNSSYRDLKTVAKSLEGRKVDSGVSVGIAPGSRQVLNMLARDGSLEILLNAGVRLLENACGFCIGNSLSPASNAVSLRTSNRNFEGRSGTASARVYLVSPETAAVAALYGRVVDPRSVEDLKYPRVRQPKKFEVDDSIFENPPEGGSKVEIVKSPNMSSVPRNEPLPEKISGVAVIKVGDKITTDHITPAGLRLKHRSSIEKYSEFVFENVDPEFAVKAAANRDNGLHNVIVAGDSYGQGSSREHAALCPMYLGVRAVVAKSIERIHMANLVNFGVLPLLFQNASDYEKIGQGDLLVIPGIRDVLENNGKAVLVNETRKIEIKLKVNLSDRQKGIVLRGGLLG